VGREGVEERVEVRERCFEVRFKCIKKGEKPGE
jgi:hypothetical protein